MRPNQFAAIVGPCLLLAACGSVGGGASSQPPATYEPSVGVNASSSSASPSPVGGIGSTVSAMASLHGRALTATGPCATPDSCFGADVINTESGTTPVFTAVVQVEGLVGAYQQNFATGTTASAAKAQVMQFLPADASATALTPISGAMTSCAYFNVTSPKLAALFPSDVSNGPFGSPAGPTVGVELSTTNGQGFTLFETGNVQRAHLTLGGDDSSMAC